MLSHGRYQIAFKALLVSVHNWNKYRTREWNETGSFLNLEMHLQQVSNCALFSDENGWELSRRQIGKLPFSFLPQFNLLFWLPKLIKLWRKIGLDVLQEKKNSNTRLLNDPQQILLEKKPSDKNVQWKYFLFYLAAFRFLRFRMSA